MPRVCQSKALDQLRAGQKAFTLRTLPPLPERDDDEPPYLAKANGFSLPQGTFSIAARSHLVARLAALVPRPRVNLTRYHGVFAPSSRLRGQITPARRGKGGRSGTEPTEGNNHEPARPQRSMTWAQRLRRVFNTPQGGFS